MNKGKSVFWALLVMLLWGSLFPMVKLGYSAYSIESTADILLFAGVRFTISCIVVCLYSFIKDRHSYIPVKPAIVPILLSGVVAIVLHYGFTYTAMQFVASSKTAILKQVGVLFYVCFSFLFFKDDKPNVKKLLGAVMGFSGIVVINSGSDGIGFGWGDILIIAASFCTVVSNIISKRVFKTVNPVTSTGVSQLFGGIVLLTVGTLLGGNMKLVFDKSALIIVYICLASIFSYCIWYSIVKKGELSKLFIIKFAEPMFACIFGALILGENVFSIQYLSSFFLICIGILVSNK